MIPGTLITQAAYLSTLNPYDLSNDGVFQNNGSITYSTDPNIRDADGVGVLFTLCVDIAFDYLENVTSISFIDVGSDNSHADFLFSDEVTSAAYASSESLGQNFKAWTDIYISPDWYNGSDATDVFSGYYYQTVVHEVLHGLGLNHLGPYNGGSGSPYPSNVYFSNDSYLNSIMSYVAPEDNPNVNAANYYLQTPMAADFLALDLLYGNQSYILENGTVQTYGSHTALVNDTIYGFNSNLSKISYPVLGYLSDYAHNNAYCIVDGGGVDTFDFSGWASDQVIDLHVTQDTDYGPTTSSIAGGYGNLTLAVGTVIENAIGGSGDDIIFGNLATNILEGKQGSDILVGFEGDDELIGGEGEDQFVLSFGSGTDIVTDYELGIDRLIFYNFETDMAISAEDVAVGYNSNGYRYYQLVDGSRLVLDGIINSTPTGVITISGTAMVGETLTAVTSTIADADGLGSFGYQWLRDGSSITGATSSTYILTHSDVGTEITVMVSYTDEYGASESLTSSPTSTVLNANKSPTGPVRISGTATEGEKLKAVTSKIADEDGLGSFEYQWLRDGLSITGATSSKYKLTQSDVGTKISVTVSYTDGYGTLESLTSRFTKVISNVNDDPVGALKVKGLKQEGKTLKAVTSKIADEDGLGSFEYQWLRDGLSITGATSSKYKLTQSDVGTKISVTVSYTDGYGTLESLTSRFTKVISNVNDDPVGALKVKGLKQEGKTLKAVTSKIADEDGLGSFEYQWLRDGLSITGATSSKYKLTQSDVGTKISVTVSYTDGYGTLESLTSRFTKVISNVNDDPVGALKVKGLKQEGKTLKAVTSKIADEDGLGSFEYQWLRDGLSITGATSSKYKLTQSDVGTKISVTVSYTDGYGTVESLISDPTDLVLTPPATVDAEGPILTSMSIRDTTVSVGETMYIDYTFTDANPLRYFLIQYEKPTAGGYASDYLDFYENNYDGVIELLITDTMASGEYQLNYISIIDDLDNHSGYYRSGDLHGQHPVESNHAFNFDLLDFDVTNPATVDAEGPILTSMSIRDTTVSVGETMYIDYTFTDANPLRYFLIQYEKPTADGYASDYLNFYENNYDGVIELLITDTMASGEYQLNYISIIDDLDNHSGYYRSGDLHGQHPVESNHAFNFDLLDFDVTNPATVDAEGPILTSMSIRDTTVSVGETMYIDYTFTDANPLRYFLIQYEKPTADGYASDYLDFYENNYDGVIELLITETMVSGEYQLNYISIIDDLDNHSGYYRSGDLHGQHPVESNHAFNFDLLDFEIIA